MNHLILAGILFIVIGLVQVGVGVADIVRHRKEVHIHHWKTKIVNEEGEVLKEEIFSTQDYRD